MSDVRIDELSGATVVMAGSRQHRPNRPGRRPARSASAAPRPPSPTTCKAFPNRWPSLPDDRCEVVLYTPEHDLTLPRPRGRRAPAGSSTCGPSAPRRSAPATDVAYVLVFENRGEEVGATIAHPHGQIYAYDQVPDAPLTELRRAARRRLRPVRPGRRRPRGGRRASGWRAWVPAASAYPYALLLAPDVHRPDLPSLDGPQRDGLAALLVDVLGRLDRLFDAPLPYMLWIHQRPTDGGPWPEAHVHVHVVSPDALARRAALRCRCRAGQRRLRQPGRPRGRRRRTARSVSGTASVGTRPGQPDRRPHRLHGWPGAADGHRPRHRDHRRPGWQLGDARIGRLRGRGRDPPRRRATTRRRSIRPGPATSPRWSTRCGPTTGWSAWSTRRCPRAAGWPRRPRSRWRSPPPSAPTGSTRSAAAQACQRAEERAVGVPCGIMDQLVSLAAVEGMALRIDCDTLEVETVRLPRRRRDRGHPLRAAPRADRRRPTPSAAPSARPPSRSSAACATPPRSTPRPSTTRCCGAAPAT